MANYGGEQHMKQDGHNKSDDQYVQNPLHSTTAAGHEMGTNIHSTTTAGHGIGGTGTTMGTGAGQGYEEGKHGGILHRSGSGSSSSSEDDGEGGRRKKKGVMGKIKEKLPGGQRGGDKQGKTSGPTTTVGVGGGHGYEGDQEQEKKGMMDKIKEKLPGSKQ